MAKLSLPGRCLFRFLFLLKFVLLTGNSTTQFPMTFVMKFMIFSDSLYIPPSLPPSWSLTTTQTTWLQLYICRGKSFLTSGHITSIRPNIKILLDCLYPCHLKNDNKMYLFLSRCLNGLLNFIWQFSKGPVGRYIHGHSLWRWRAERYDQGYPE